MSLPSLAVIIAVSIAVAIALTQLGALSVWVSVLSLSLKFLATLAIGALLFYMWQRFRRN